MVLVVGRTICELNCPQGQYKSLILSKSTTLCAYCISNCQSCSDGVTCTSCFSSYVLLYDSKGCVLSCPDGNQYSVRGQYYDTSMCQQCPDIHCSSCSDSTYCQ
jgi:hypothetical protein